MNSMKFYEQDKYFMEKMKYLNKGRNKNKNNKNNNFQTCRTVRDSLTVKNENYLTLCRTLLILIIEFVMVNKLFQYIHL